MIGSREQPWMKCEDCKTEFCMIHSLAHDADEKCEDYESRMLHGSGEFEFLWKPKTTCKIF